MKLFFFAFFVLCNFENAHSAATYKTIVDTTEKVKRAYRTLIGDNNNEYLKEQFKTHELRNIIKNYFHYEDSFNKVNLLEFFLEDKNLNNLKNQFKVCENSNLCNTEYKIENLNLKDLTDAGTKAFFKKIIDKEVLVNEGLINQDGIERNLTLFLNKASEFIKTRLQTILEKDNKNFHDLFPLKNEISINNQTNLKFISDKIKNKDIFTLIHFLSNDFYFFQQMCKNIIEFSKNNNINVELKENSLLHFVNQKKFESLKNFFLQEQNDFEKILDSFLYYNNQILEKIKDDRSKLITFYSIYFSFPFDFSLFDDQQKFKSYILCLYSAFLFYIEKDNQNIDIIEKANLLISFLDKATEINTIYFEPDRKNIVNKNLKNLLILYFLLYPPKDKKKLEKINFKNDIFTLYYKNLIKFNLKEDSFYDQKISDQDLVNILNQIISQIKFTENKSGIFVDNIDLSIFNKVFSNLFFMNEMRKEKNFLDLNSESWFRGKVSLLGYGESLRIDDKIASIKFQSLYGGYVADLKGIVLQYNIFLSDIANAIAVIFLEDCYTPYSRISYRIKSKTNQTLSKISQNKKKTIFFGTLFGGLALLYKYQDKKLPQFLIQKSGEFIPFLKQYLPLFKKKFLSGISKLK